MGDSVERRDHAYRNSQKQSGPTDQYWSKWLNLVMLCQVVVPGQSEKPWVGVFVDQSTAAPAASQNTEGVAL